MNSLEQPIRRTKPKLQPTIVIDTREQEPFRFEHFASETATLQTGDYSIRGLEGLVVVERKSLPDLLACIGRERERFKRELERLRSYRFRLLVVEADADTLERGEWRGDITPASVVGSLAAWCGQFSLPVWLAGNHEAAGRFVERFLFQAARTIATEHEAAIRFLEAVASD